MTLVPKPSRLVLAAAGIALLWAPTAQARQNVSIATPFDVGESPAGNYLAALVAGAERDTLAAATFFRETLRAAPHNRELMERAFIASLANGNMPDAFALAEKLIKLDAGNGLANLALGVRDFKQKRYAEARAHYTKSGAGRQRDLTAVLLTAWSYIGSRQPQKAIETIGKLHDEGLTLLRDYHMALMEDLAKRPAQAREKFETVYAADKSTFRIVDAYGRFLSQQGKRAEAREVYEAYERLAPRHPLVVSQLAIIDSGASLEPAVSTAEAGAAEVLYGLGSIGGRQGDELAAMVYLRLALYLNPDDALALVALAETQERLKQYAQAIDAYAMVQDKSPLRTTADTQIGLLLEMAGKSDQASQYLAGVVAENPTNAEAYLALGNLQRTRKEFESAAQSYSKALELSGGPEKTLWPLYYFRGIAYERTKNWDAAEADFKKALSLYPDQPLVLNYLGYSWVDKGVNLDEAFKMLRRAVELRPQDGYIVDSLGWAYYKLGRYEDATRELERAIELKPSDPVINDHLGDAYWRIGRKLEAQFQWNHARDLKPEPEELPNILKKIEYGLPDSPKPTAAEAETKNGGG